MSKRLLALMVMLLVFAGGSALADHKDPHPDGAATRCDTWWRADGYDPDGDHNTHEDPGTSTPTEIAIGGPDNTHIISEGGHYVINSNSFYIEVVGGQNYARPINPNGSRGGWVQGEVDIAGTPADVDFLVGTFSGAPAPNPTYAEKDLCLSVADQRVDLRDCKTPPLPSSANCNP